MMKAIKLELPRLTRKKKELIEQDRQTATRMLTDIILPVLDSCADNTELQKKTYHPIRRASNLHSQVVLNLIRNSMALKSKPLDKRNVNALTLDYNLPRTGSLIENGGTWYAKLSVGGSRIALPILPTKNFDRLQAEIKRGWKLKQLSLTKNFFLIATISKKKSRVASQTFLGIDVNANNLALTVADNKGKIKKQLYLGQNVWQHKARILKRKSVLQSKAAKGSCRAKSSLRKLKRKLSNFTKNACGELSKKVHEIATAYNALIVLERLTKFEPKFSKKANRKISLIPFALLNQRIITRSVDNGNPLSYVDAYHTSKWCPYCGAVNNGHSKKNYAVYECGVCKRKMNSDRKASYVIALKKLIERQNLTSVSGVPVNALFRRNEGVGTL